MINYVIKLTPLFIEGWPEGTTSNYFFSSENIIDAENAFKLSYPAFLNEEKFSYIIEEA